MEKNRFISTILGVVVGFSLALGTGTSQAEDVPTGPVILEISGAIEKTNGDAVMRYDREMLAALGTYDVVTETPWTEGLVRFTGVLARDVMDSSGAKGTYVTAFALNDFSVEIPIQDFEEHDVILAFQKDGEVMSVRDKGPLWVIYPWSDNSNLRKQLFYSRSIWQLNAIHVQSE